MSEQRVDSDAGVFIGSIALITALYDTYVEHVGVTEPEGPNGPYIGCACGWRSDDLSTDNPGEGYAVHLTNAQHTAAVKALQPIVRRVLPPAKFDEEADALFVNAARAATRVTPPGTPKADEWERREPTNGSVDTNA